MKKFLGIIVLGLLLTTPSQADDIRDFQIEGMSIGNSALDYFSEEEIIILREFLLRGSFLHADDNYGMDKSFRREMKRVFPNKDFVELPYDHPLFHSYYDFPNGLPKVHEHDGKDPQAFGLFNEDRLMVLYTYECDLGDGWEDEEVHKDPADIREKALQMGVNIIYFALTQ